MWIARDKPGNLWWYEEEPKRGEEAFIQQTRICAALPTTFYPELTWENSPKELILKEE